MGYSNYLDTALDLSIDDAVGKLAENIPPCASLEVRPNSGRARNQNEGVRRFANKRLCRLEAPLKIPLKRVIDLPKSFWDNLNPSGAH
jgi:hypothetical protein